MLSLIPLGAKASLTEGFIIHLAADEIASTER
jgi:hypothetical protein